MIPTDEQLDRLIELSRSNDYPVRTLFASDDEQLQSGRRKAIRAWLADVAPGTFDPLPPLDGPANAMRGFAAWLASLPQATFRD